MITITVNSPWYELLKSGEKQYEGRRLTEKMKRLREGDLIQIQHHMDRDQVYTMMIESLHIYPTFEHALSSLPLEKVLPIEDISISKGVEIYKQFVSIPTQERDGIIMLKLSYCL